MRPRQTRDSMPQDYSCVFGLLGIGLAKSNIFDALRIKMNFTMVLLRQPFEQLRKRALGAVAAIDEWGNNREPQVSGSSGGPTAAQPRS
jgi:hypothetical protein